MDEHDLREVEVGIKKFKEQVVTGEALSRLMKNKDFKKVILGFFLADKVDELIKQKCTHGLQHPDEQAYIEKGLIAAGYLAQFMEEVKLMAENAKVSIERYEETQDEILNGEVE